MSCVCEVGLHSMSCMCEVGCEVGCLWMTCHAFGDRAHLKLNLKSIQRTTWINVLSEPAVTRTKRYVRESIAS